MSTALKININNLDYFKTKYTLFILKTKFFIDIKKKIK